MYQLRETHDQLLHCYLKIKSGEVSREAFVAMALQTGFIDEIENIFLRAVSNSTEISPDWSWKPHWGMIETLLRALKTPTLHSIGTTLQPQPLDLKSLDISEACVDYLLQGSGKAREVVNYVSEIIQTGVISFPSLINDEKLISDKGFIHYLEGKPHVFYVFFEKYPVLTIVNPNLGNIIAVYIPHRNVIVGHDYKYEKPIARLKIEIIRNIDQVRNYISSETKKKPVLISAFMQHTGHTLLNELPGFDLILDQIGDGARLPVLVGPHEFLPIKSVFPEFARQTVSKFNLTQSDIFRYCLQNSILPVRPMMRYYFISERFRSRLRKASVGGRRSDHKGFGWKFPWWSGKKNKDSLDVLVNKNPQKSITVWIEVRNNHRIWLNQVDAIKTIITKMIDHYPSASVFIAGWSVPEDSTKEDDVQIELDMKVYQELFDFAGDRLQVICGVGLSSEEKLRWAFRCSASVVSFGSGMTLPCLVANLPSIVHTNSFYLNRQAMNPDVDERLAFAENLKPYIVIPAEHITDDASEPRYQVRNYSVNGDVIFEALRKILDSV